MFTLAMGVICKCVLAQVAQPSFINLTLFSHCRYMCGMDLEEFSHLYGLLRDHLIREFPKTAEYGDPDDPMFRHLTLSSLLLLTLMHLRHSPSWRHIGAQCGFDPSYVHKCSKKIKDMLTLVLVPVYFARPSFEELASDGRDFFNTCNIGGMHTNACCAVDDTYYLMCKPLDSDVEEQYYSGYKKYHAIKLVMVCSLLRKRIFSIDFVLPRVSDIESYRTNWVYYMLDPTGEELTALADKGMNDVRDLRTITPYKEDQITAAVYQGQTQRERNNIKNRLVNFNREHGSYRVVVECAIGDLTRWSAARGKSTAKIYGDVDTAKEEITICAALTKYLYMLRGL